MTLTTPWGKSASTDLMPASMTETRPQFTPVPLTSSRPVATARIESSTASRPGKFGLLAPIIDVRSTEVLPAASIGVLLTPSDPEAFRMNIGVRSLFSGAVMEVRTFDANGAEVSVVKRTYAPTWLEQVDAASFIGAAVPAGGTIHVLVTEGQAIVYGAIVDNETNDPSMQTARQENFISYQLRGQTY
jgi:hypothetical protein